MRFKTILKFSVFLFLMFVFLGDKILPKPLNQASLQTRTTINSYLLGLFPDKKPRDPYERTEKAIDQVDK